MTTFFTSDQHFGHDRIRIYCRRPFQNVDHMDIEMMKAWNEVVGQDDTIWHLGDFTLGNLEAFLMYASRLNGRINIVPGGHDYKWVGDWAHVMHTDGWRIPGTIDAWLYPPLHSLIIKRKGERPMPIVMCHYPMASWDRSHYGSLHLHGHVHNTWGKDAHITPSDDKQLPPGLSRGVRINMSVEVWDYHPASLEVLLDMAGISGTL